ncbi:antA/AntB antirepressor family protein [Candidatus Accumulibacter sp. ACC003]|uniref:antA/AntB antirepressor family protein n=1 Tax=Candidatus Accumulibacter sp. ACC003 TaxID=2823334 RepID=UPI0025BA188E|nr:antA/AntB antirepressor family protein [Candidatus Accumulibacter sp. ACC003]
MTTTDLLPEFVGTLAGQDTPLGNARDLHAALGDGRHVATWIKQRIAEYGFAEGEDSVFDSQKRGNQTGRGADRRSRD